MSFLFLGPNQSGKSYASRNKEQFKKYFQHFFGSQLSMGSVEMLIAGSYSKINSLSDLESQMFTSCHSLGIELGYEAVCAIKLHELVISLIH